MNYLYSHIFNENSKKNYTFYVIAIKLERKNLSIPLPISTSFNLLSVVLHCNALQYVFIRKRIIRLFRCGSFDMKSDNYPDFYFQLTRNHKKIH